MDVCARTFDVHSSVASHLCLCLPASPDAGPHGAGESPAAITIGIKLSAIPVSANIVALQPPLPPPPLLLLLLAILLALSVFFVPACLCEPGRMIKLGNNDVGGFDRKNVY